MWSAPVWPDSEPRALRRRQETCWVEMLPGQTLVAATQGTEGKCRNERRGSPVRRWLVFTCYFAPGSRLPE